MPFSVSGQNFGNPQAIRVVRSRQTNVPTRRRPPMKTLSTLDTLFVTMDSDRFPMTGGGVMIFDPSTSPEPYSPARLREHLRRLLPAMPPLRRRLVEVPFGLSAPVWVEDPDFDIDRHIHHIAVPAPGGDHEVAALISEIGSLPLDWSRPLWDMWYIDGLADGRIGLFMRIHHCAIDGMGGVEMIFQMFTMEPGQTPEAAPTDDWKPESVPSQIEMLVRSTPAIAARPLRSARAIANLGLGLVRGSLPSRSDADKVERIGGAQLFSGPRLPVNEIPSGVPHKSMSFADVEMSDIKRIRELHGCTVNDVVLAAATAAIRRWLIDHNALPNGPITAGNPMNTRTVDEKGAFENKFTIFGLQLPTHLASPVERLMAIKQSTESAKAATQTSGTDVLDNVFQVFAPGFTELVVTGLTAGLGKRMPSPFNTIVTNVQGPPIPLYLAGAKLERMYIQMMQTAGLSLVFAVMSYAGKIYFSVTGHRENTPDIWTFAEEIDKEVARLLAKKPAKT
jgi:diacylglycerol O-acyltransferase / wax synthase